jgi:hypothetical protein
VEWQRTRNCRKETVALVGRERTGGPEVPIFGSLGIEVTARTSSKGATLAQELEWLENWIGQKAEEKRAQATDAPTMLLVDVTLAGEAWLRDDDIWATRLARNGRGFESFSGVIVVTGGYDRADFASCAVAISEPDSLPSAQWVTLQRALRISPR